MALASLPARKETVVNAAVLPRQIQDQLDEADRIQASLAAPTETPALTAVNTSVAPPAVPSEPAVVVDPATPANEPQLLDDTWQRRYEVLQGKYNAEVPKLHQELRNTAMRVQALETQLLTQTRTSQQQQTAQPETLVSAKDEEIFGSDLIDAMRRVARDEFRAGAAASLAPQAQRVERVEQEVAQAKTDRFWLELKAAIPDHEAVNTDPRWLAWLSEYDPVAGVVRQASLDAAAGQLDYRRVIGMFQAFKAIAAPAAPQQEAQQSSNQAELARQVAPARSSKTTVTSPAERMYTGAEYAYWVDPRRANDTPKAQREAMSAEVERALVENRVQW